MSFIYECHAERMQNNALPQRLCVCVYVCVHICVCF